jgi:asparagine synthase (glutamine-hydrolysing)
MDKNAMQHSVETRVPFLDPEVVALVVNLPLEARIGPQVKGILRDAALARLPRAIARRPKQGGPSLDSARFLDAATRPEFLADGLLREVLAVPAPSWQDTVTALTRKRKLSWWTTEIWCRLLLDDRPADDVADELWSRRRVTDAAGFEPATQAAQGAVGR